MNQSLASFAIALSIAACARGPEPKSPADQAAETPAPAPAASATTAASSDATPASAAASAAPPPAGTPATDPRGIKAGYVPVISYRSPEVPNKCFAFYGTPEDKAQMTDDKARKFLSGFGKKGQKGPVPVIVPGCPTEHLTGFCYVTVLDVSESYYSAPAAAAAKKKCVPPDGVWSE